MTSCAMRGSMCDGVKMRHVMRLVETTLAISGFVAESLVVHAHDTFPPQSHAPLPCDLVAIHDLDVL